jgi:uncharacterized repeat protein (TIGR01451 family)
LVWLAALGSGILVAPPAAAVSDAVFTVDSVAYGPGDADTDDERCENTNGECTLLAAIEQGNAMDAAVAVSIEVSSVIDGGSSSTVEAPATSADWEGSRGVGYVPNNEDKGAYYRITRSMTIDLDNRLHLAPKSNSSSATGFWVEAAGVHLRRFTDIFASGTSITFSPRSSDSSLIGGETVQFANDYSDRFVMIMAGAANITIKDYKVGRMKSTAVNGYGTMIGFGRSSADPNSPVTNTVISSVTFDNAPEGSGRCTASDGTGCNTHGVAFFDAVKIEGLAVTDSAFNNFKVPAFYGWTGNQPTIADLDLRDNTFTDIQVGSQAQAQKAAVTLPHGQKFGGLNYIRGNKFLNNPNLNQGTAIYWFGPGSGTVDSNLYIEDNQFDGYVLQTIHLENANNVTVRRNTFGANTLAGLAVWPNWPDKVISQFEEFVTGVTDRAMLAQVGTNGRPRPWYPAAVEPSACGLKVRVDSNNYQVSGSEPVVPVAIDFYWTKGSTASPASAAFPAGQAEVYLGTVENVQTSGSVIAVPGQLPGDGYVRIQTQGSGNSATGGQPQSTQYSRMLAVKAGAQCMPEMELNLDAWMDVPAGATTYGDIFGQSTELLSASQVPLGADVWFTYTVRNTGDVPLTGVKVQDTLGGYVCVITEEIPVDGSAGCVRHQGAF